MCGRDREDVGEVVEAAVGGLVTRPLRLDVDGPRVEGNEGAGRVGVEWYYTGAQRLEENPFRDRSKPYMIVGALAERLVGRLRVFVNGENLSGVTQTRYDPLIRPTRAADGRWTVDAWAPLEGRNVNGGIRLHF